MWYSTLFNHTKVELQAWWSASLPSLRKWGTLRHVKMWVHAFSHQLETYWHNYWLSIIIYSHLFTHSCNHTKACQVALQSDPAPITKWLLCMGCIIVHVWFLPRMRMCEGVKQLVLSVCQSVSLSICQSVSLSSENFWNLNIDGVKWFPKLAVALTL